MNLVGIDVTTAASTTPRYTPGIIHEAYDGKRYKYVKYSNGTADLTLAVGDMLFYVDDTGFDAHTVEADNSDASGQPIGAGAACVAVTTDLSYLWIQTYGNCTLAVALGGSAGDGDPLTVKGAADKALTKAAEADSTGVYKDVCAVAIDASEKQVFLKCVA